LVGGGLSGLVVGEEQEAARELHHEEEQGQPAEVVPGHRVAADGHFLVLHVVDERRDAETLVDPVVELHASPLGAPSWTTTDPSGSRWQENFASGRGG